MAFHLHRMSSGCSWQHDHNFSLLSPGASKHALLSGCMWKRNRKVSLWKCGTEMACTIVFTLELPSAKHLLVLVSVSAHSPISFPFPSFLSMLLGVHCLCGSQGPQPLPDLTQLCDSWHCFLQGAEHSSAGTIPGHRAQKQNCRGRGRRKEDADSNFWWV